VTTSVTGSAWWFACEIHWTEDNALRLAERINTLKKTGHRLTSGTGCPPDTPQITIYATNVVKNLASERKPIKIQPVLTES
jgi:hypothetical protein